MGRQHGRVEVVGAVSRVAEEVRRAVRRHRAGGGHDTGVTVDELGCLRLGRAVRTHPAVPNVRLQMERLQTLRSAGPLYPPLSPEVSHLEHALKRGVQHPVVPLPILAGFLDRHLQEAVVQGQVVPHAVLPTFLIIRVIGKPGADEVINPSEGQPLARALTDGHCYQSHVGIRWLLRGAVLRVFGPQGQQAGADVLEPLLLGRCFLSRVHGSEIQRVRARPAGEPTTCTALLTEGRNRALRLQVCTPLPQVFFHLGGFPRHLRKFSGLQESRDGLKRGPQRKYF